MKNNIEEFIEKYIEFLDTNYLNSCAVLNSVSEEFVIKFKMFFDIKSIASQYPDFFSDSFILENIELFPNIHLEGRTQDFKVSYIEKVFQKRGIELFIQDIFIGNFKYITKKIYKQLEMSNQKDKYSDIKTFAVLCVDIDDEFLKKNFDKNSWTSFCSNINITEDFMIENFSETQIKSVILHVKNRKLDKLILHAMKNKVFFQETVKRRFFPKNNELDSKKRINIFDYKRHLNKIFGRTL